MQCMFTNVPVDTVAWVYVLGLSALTRDARRTFAYAWLHAWAGTTGARMVSACFPALHMVINIRSDPCSRQNATPKTTGIHDSSRWLGSGRGNRHRWRTSSPHLYSVPACSRFCVTPPHALRQVLSRLRTSTGCSVQQPGRPTLFPLRGNALMCEVCVQLLRDMLDTRLCVR
jgi:hypothetical protein